MADPLTIHRVTYHGGFSHLRSDDVPVGRLVADDDVLMLKEGKRDRLLPDCPPVEMCRTSAVVSIEVLSEPPKSKAREFLFFGLVGAAIAAGEEGPTLVVHLESGEAGYFTAGHQSAASVLGTVTPWMREHGIALGP